jgi:S1-C subfamily serine protease
MTVQVNRFGIRARMATLVAVLGLILAANAWGDEAERKAMFAKVNPSVVKVRQERSLGSGFVVAIDGDTAVAVTNYHVVEGAKKITIFFPADDREMKDGHDADGYIEIMPERDLALVHFKLNGKKVTSLELAKNLPEQGELVYTFAASVGQRNTLAQGKVVSVRTGKEVADLMERLGKDVYLKAMRYTLDATWIQHTAPMSYGNSGGPLVNEKGEIIGLSTMTLVSENTSTKGESLNYAISATHLAKMLEHAGKNVKPWSSLPSPRE